MLYVSDTMISIIKLDVYFQIKSILRQSNNQFRFCKVATLTTDVIPILMPCLFHNNMSSWYWQNCMATHLLVEMASKLASSYGNFSLHVSCVLLKHFTRYVLLALHFFSSNISATQYYTYRWGRWLLPMVIFVYTVLIFV